MNYYSSSSKHNLVSLIAIILAVVLLLGALVTVLGVGSNGFKDWSIFNGIPKSSYNMEIESLDDLVGVKLGRDDFSYRMSTYDMSDAEREEENVPEGRNMEYFSAILNVDGYGVDFNFPEEGVYTFTVEINGEEYVMEGIEVYAPETSENGLLAQINIIKEEGESETNIFEGDGKGYAIMLANANFFNIEQEALVEGGAGILLYNVDCEKIESFELVSYERTGDLVIPEVEEDINTEANTDAE